MEQANNSEITNDRIIRELADIKWLLIVQLMTSGAEARYIARALGTSQVHPFMPFTGSA